MASNENPGTNPSKGFEYKDKRPLRRKKTVAGDEFAGLLESAMEATASQRKSGILCRECHKRAPWRDIDYEYEPSSDGRFIRRAYHKYCGNMVREEIIGEPSGD